jgi:hypothetical protein
VGHMHGGSANPPEFCLKMIRDIWVILTSSLGFNRKS